ncbi:hypothetical protein D3C87_1836870 [compost metagenome]
MMSAIGSRAATPAGFRVRALTAPAQLRASFFQAAVLKSGVVETAIGVWANRAVKASPAAPSGTRIEPSRRWRTRPGALRSAGMSTTAGVIRSAAT